MRKRFGTAWHLGHIHSGRRDEVTNWDIQIASLSVSLSKRMAAKDLATPIDGIRLELTDGRRKDALDLVGDDVLHVGEWSGHGGS